MRHERSAGRPAADLPGGAGDNDVDRDAGDGSGTGGGDSERGAHGGVDRSANRVSYFPVRVWHWDDSAFIHDNCHADAEYHRELVAVLGGESRSNSVRSDPDPNARPDPSPDV